jgi:putative restriction endonuclease
MPVQLIVIVTDGDWFDHLRQHPDLSEVNFWSPSDTNFRALQPGELFLFKLHSPNNFIVGGGVFAHASPMPCSVAWDAFKEKNGAASLSQMRARIARYRRVVPDDREDFTVGCRILTQPFFLDRSQWIPAPESFALRTVTFKTYSTDNAEGRGLWEFANHFLSNAKALPTVRNETGVLEDVQQARYGEPVLVLPRLGQGAFRMLVTDNYGRRCAISRERTLPALDAAHIRPFADGGSHQISNGILLRRDIHSLFDLGYVTISPNLEFEVSKKIREEYENGRDYYAYHGKDVTVPGDPRGHPDRTALVWHNENRFKG